MTRDSLRLFEIASVLLRFSVAASFVVKANHSIDERLTLLRNAVLFSVTRSRWVSVDLACILGTKGRCISNPSTF